MDAEAWRQLARAYKSLSEQDRQHFQDLGQKATVVHAMGRSTFPIHSRRALHARGHGGDRVLGGDAPSPAQRVSAQLAERVCSGLSCSVPLVPESGEVSIQSCQKCFAAVVTAQVRNAKEEARVREAEQLEKQKQCGTMHGPHCTLASPVKTCRV